MGIDGIVFDNEGTLYRTSPVLEETVVNQHMLPFLAKELGISLERVKELRDILKKRHDTNSTPYAFVKEYPQIDHGRFASEGWGPYAEGNVDLSQYGIVPNPELAKVLGKVNIPKVVLTSNSALHARQILKNLGISEHIDDVLGYKEVEFIAKPNRHAYECAKKAIEEKLGRPAENIVMFEDNPIYLKTPKEMGWGTILIKNPDKLHPRKREFLPYVDRIINPEFAPHERAEGIGRILGVK